MLQQGILWEEEGILGIGRQGEENYGRRHFLELLSVFLSPPLFAVLHGRRELGFVDELTFHGKQDGPRVLLLGGRAWRVTHIDWQRKTARVEPSEDRGRTRWKGEGQGLSFRLCQAIEHVLAGNDSRDYWSRRAKEQIDVDEPNSRGSNLKDQWSSPTRTTASRGGPSRASRRTPAWRRRSLKPRERSRPYARQPRREIRAGRDARGRGVGCPGTSVARGQRLRAEHRPGRHPGVEVLRVPADGDGADTLRTRTQDPVAVEHVLRAPIRFVSS